MSSKGDVTTLISLWMTGDKQAENRLFELLYHELRVRARGILAGEHDQQSLGSAGLVHAAYLELMKSGRVNISDRSHFLNFAAQVMRRIVIDRARARGAKKRGSEIRFLPEDESEGLPVDDKSLEILMIARALSKPEVLSSRQHQVVNMLYFAGYSVEETAILLRVASKTVRRDFGTARARLRIAIEGSKFDESDAARGTG